MNKTKSRKTYNEFVNDDELNLLNENYEKFIVKFRRHYRTGTLLTFRQWLNVVGDLLDEIV